ncbi:major facilitator superfamily domain-containing protein [Xylariaceae sp. FL0804]|nr:major facilitator superfamily domain-containing protein [Xylariaceae sp. FL0804]
MADDLIATASSTHKDEYAGLQKPTKRLRTLGNVRLRDVHTNELILIPTPTADPNDPLNWSQGYKYYMATIICIAIMMSNFLAAGPTIAIVSTTMDFFPNSPLAPSISKVAYFFTTTALLQGTSNFFWMPLTNKYGRRPVYITSYLFYFIVCLWLVFEKEYKGFLAGRLLLGIGSGAAETIAPLSIADVFFLHERGTIMSFYTAFLSVGVALGIVIDGLIVIHNDWRVIYEVACALIGLVLVLAFFTFPETAYPRAAEQQLSSDVEVKKLGETAVSAEQREQTVGLTPGTAVIPPKETYLRSLRIYHRKLTDESLAKMFVRPLGLICLPPVLWAALVQSVTIGFLVAVTSNVATAYQTAYGFAPWQCGLCFIAAILGSLIGIPAGGKLGDLTADWFTKRNGGVRDPEMRLPAMTLSLVSAPLSLVLYGVGIGERLHWICPTIGLALLNFSITQGTNVCLVYVIDAYRPVAGEITLSVMGFKSLFGFLLSFYTNPWVNESGYTDAFGAMAGISALVILLWVPLYFWGKAIRHTTWNWPVISSIHWKDDREVGE